MGAKLKTALRTIGSKVQAASQRWRDRWLRRRADMVERRNAARENLRDFKQYSGHEGGTPGGG
jgi:hypothetical protein